MKTLKLSHRASMIMICVVTFITFFVNNHVIEPDIMESRNLITAREMVYDGNWLVPTMNGDLRLEKPPLPTWFAAGAEVLAPDNISAQRFMAGCAALVLILFFWKFAKYILHISPIIPSLILCTCYNFILMARTATWDIYCHAFMMGAIYFMARALLSPGPQWSRLSLSGILIGLSFISKGPVSLYALFLPFIVAFGWMYRPSIKGKILPIGVMILIAVAIGCWWFIYVRIAVPEAFDSVIAKESGSWINHNVRPWWYYWQFFLESGIWSLLLLTSIFVPLFFSKQRTNSQWLFSLTWMLGSLVLLSLLPEKKPRYLLPLLIPASYLMASQIRFWNKTFGINKFSRCESIIFRINAGLLFVVTLVLPVLAWIFAVVPGYMSVGLWILFTIADLGATIILGYAVWRRIPDFMIAGVTVVFLAAVCFAMPSVAKIAGNPDKHSLSLSRNVEELKDIPFYYLDGEPLRIELVYAADKKISPIDLDTIDRVVPCALLSHKEASAILDSLGVSGLQIREIDFYDDNPFPKGSKRYKPDFLYHLTLIKK